MIKAVKQVLAYELKRLPGSIDKDDQSGSTTQGVQAETTRAGKKITYSGIANRLAENAEERFSHPVTGGPDSILVSRCFGRDEFSASLLSSGYAQLT